MVPLGATLVLSPGAAADPLSSAQARATQLETQIQSTGRQMDALDQQYLAAEARKTHIEHQISATQLKVDRTKQRVAKDRLGLKKVAVRAYITDGGATTQDSLFVGNQTQVDDAKVFHQVATGDLTTAVATLQTAQAQLDALESTLRTQDQQAQQAVTTADNAYRHYQTLHAQQQAALSQVKGKIAVLVTQQRKAQQLAEERLAAAQLAGLSRSGPTVRVASSGTAHPPPAGGGAGAAAVAAAESQLGVPYVWGGESPGRGFDCSGLTSWAWAQAGVYLPHYSGAQMADSTPVSISDLQPGDLLFYGPGGSTHVAMYIGGGAMIEAPYTGAYVWVTAVRLGTGFAGAGRP